MGPSLAGKVAIITGGATGQGAAAARLFAAEGARVVIITGSNEVAGRQVTAEIGDAALFIKHDVADEAGWDAVVKTTLERFGRIDVLLNNAATVKNMAVQDTDTATLDRMMRVNVYGPFFAIRAVVEPMKRAGGGSIINVGSGNAIKAYPGKFPYAVSKWALRGVTRSAAMDLAPFGIRVNSLIPGVVDTPMLRNSDMRPDLLQQVMNSIPLGRAGQPEELAKAALFLASDASSFMTGAEMVVDGGSVA